MRVITLTNLFGEEEKFLVGEQRYGARKPTVPKGYAAPPGTGPQGETCKTCKHKAAPTQTARVYWKCRMMIDSWTGGPGTDIRMRSPACRHWEKIEEKE